MDGDLDPAAKSGEMLVDGVVQHLKHAVMKTALVRIANVHARPLTNSLQTFEFIDLSGIVLLLGGDLGFVLRRIDWRIGHGAGKGSEITVAETRNFSKKRAS